MKKTVLFLSFLAFSICVSTAQNASDEVSKLDTYFDDYSDELRGYRLALIGDTTIISTQKFKLYIQHKEELKEKFQKERREEYENLDGRTITLQHSCTKGNSGGSTRDCGTQFLLPPEGYKKKPGTYGSSGKGSPSETDKGAQIHMQKSGKGRDEGWIYFDIELDKKWLDQHLKNETRKLFGDIVSSHKKQYPNEGPYW